LIKKQKIKSAEMLLCRTWPLPCKSGKTTGRKILPCYRSRRPALQQKVTMPLPTHYPPVLPDFIRSCSADELRFNDEYCKIKRSAKACQGARPGVWPVKWQRSA